MAAKIYSNPNIVADTSSELGPQAIAGYLQQMSQNRMANQADERAESRLIMEEASHKWQMDTSRKTLNAQNALMEFSGEGYDWQGLAQAGNLDIFGQDLPDAGLSFQKYQEAMAVNGTSADLATFFDSKTANDQRYMNAIKGKFNALFQTLKYAPENAGSDDRDIYRYMQQHYNADKVYANYINAFGANDPMTGLKYEPTERKQGILERAKGWLVNPPVTGPGGEQVGGGMTGIGSLASLAAPGGLVGGAYKGMKQYQASSKEFLDQAQKNWAKPTYEKVKDKKTKKMKFKLDKSGNKIRSQGSGMTGPQFQKEYGFTKKAGGGMGKTFKASESILESARSAGYKGTWPSKATVWATKKGTEAIEWGKTLKSPKAAMGKVNWGKVKNIAKGGLPFMAPGIGSLVGEVVTGNETGKNVGKSIGVGVLVNKTGAYGTGKKAGQSFVNYVAKRFPEIAAKAGVMSQLDSPVIPVMDFIALGWSSYEIYKLYKEWSKQLAGG